MKISNFKFSRRGGIPHLRGQILGIFTFVLFAVFSFLVSKDIFRALDFNTTVKIQDRLGDSLIGPFSIFSLLGSAEIASIILLLTLILSKKLKSIFVLFFYGLVGFFELYGKSVIEQKGPPILFLKTHLPFQFPSSYIPHEFFAYPSGHSARTAFVSAVLLFAIYANIKNRKPRSRFALSALALAAAGVLIFDLIMFVSRVYLGEHWTTDVIRGILLGASLALLASYFIDGRKLPSRVF